MGFCGFKSVDKRTSDMCNERSKIIKSSNICKFWNCCRTCPENDFTSPPLKLAKTSHASHDPTSLVYTHFKPKKCILGWWMIIQIQYHWLIMDHSFWVQDCSRSFQFHLVATPLNRLWQKCCSYQRNNKKTTATARHLNHLSASCGTTLPTPRLAGSWVFTHKAESPRSWAQCPWLCSQMVTVPVPACCHGWIGWSSDTRSIYKYKYIYIYIYLYIYIYIFIYILYL